MIKHMIEEVKKHPFAAALSCAFGVLAGVITSILSSGLIGLSVGVVVTIFAFCTNKVQ